MTIDLCMSRLANSYTLLPFSLSTNVVSLYNYSNIRTRDNIDNGNTFSCRSMHYNISVGSAGESFELDKSGF